MATRGRPRGTKLGKALTETSQALQHVRNLDTIMDKMSDRERKLYVSLARGRDALEAAIESGYRSWFEGISKQVFKSDGTHLWTKEVSMRNVHELSDESYAKLLRYCESQLKKDHPFDNYVNYIANINDFFKLIAPDIAIGLSNMFFDEPISPGLKAKLGFGLLDRGGYKEPEEHKPFQSVTVNIVAPPTPEKITAEVIEVINE